MLIHPTVERLRALGLTAMADAFIEMQNAPEAAELTREDWLGLLVDREATSRENKRLPARAAPSLAKALRGARVSPPWGLRGRSAADLTGPTMPMQPTLMSAAWSVATITPGFNRS